MKVLHINEHLALKGGVETYLLSTLPKLEKQGIQPVYVYGKGNPEQYPVSYNAPALGLTGFKHQHTARIQVREILQKTEPDLIHVHNVQNIGALQAAFDFAPTVVTTHDYRWVCPANTFFYKNTQEVCNRLCGLGCFTTTLSKHCLTPRPGYASYFYYRTKWTLRNADRFAHTIAPSSGARNRYVKSGFPAEKITVLPYFCSIEPSKTPRPIPNRPTITFLGRIAPNKGHEYFIKALGLLPEEVQGIMVGNIPADTAKGLQEFARRHGCADRLELHPWASREEVLALMDQTSVFIFPSLWPETLGIVGLEALSRGVPVVASDLGGVREWCINGETGYLVPPKNPDAIAEKVNQLISSEQQLRDFGARGIQLIKNRFTPETHVNNLVQLYKNIIDE